jgi:hypothetical protein
VGVRGVAVAEGEGVRRGARENSGEEAQKSCDATGRRVRWRSEI